MEAFKKFVLIFAKLLFNQHKGERKLIILLALLVPNFIMLIVNSKLDLLSNTSILLYVMVILSSVFEILSVPLFKFISKYIIQNLTEPSRDSKLPNENNVYNKSKLSILGKMYEKDLSNGNILIFGGLIFTFITITGGLTIYIPIIFFSTYLLLASTKFITVYRVKKGWYCNNEHEVYKIINFLLSEASKEDLYNGPNKRKLIDLNDFVKENKLQTRHEIEGAI